MKDKLSTCRMRGTKGESEFQTGIEPMTSQTQGGHRFDYFCKIKKKCRKIKIHML